MISKGHEELIIRHQCRILLLNRPSYYYEPSGGSTLNLELMRLMDEHYLEHPYKGAERMHTWLTMDKGFAISLNRVARLYYRVMGLRAVMPGPHTSKKGKGHTVYPYLLRDLAIERPNQVCGTDITYVPMPKGFMYLVAIVDHYSRYVVGWSLSNTMSAEWCQECLQEAIEARGKPEIVNTDQGSQFTSEVYSKYVLSEGIKLSMDGKGRALDNVYIERFWRDIKYEKLYINPADDGHELYRQVLEYMDEYNYRRRHGGVANRPPGELYRLAELMAA